jgi:salicylate hydroxylase
MLVVEYAFVRTIQIFFQNMNKIAIFGAGVGGLMTKIALDRQGFDSCIYEKSSESQPDGMGFILLAAGLESLRQFGVLRGCGDLGIPLWEYRQLSPDGELIKAEAMPAGALGVPRQQLLRALRRQVDREHLYFESGLDKFQIDGLSQVEKALLEDGRTVEADLYVAADGIHSRGRRLLFKNWPMPEAQVQEIVGVVSGNDFLRWSDHSFHKFIDPQGGLAFGAVPVAIDKLVWFMQFDTKRYPPPARQPEAHRRFVCSLMEGWAEPIPNILAATDFSKTHLWRPIDTEVVPSFYDGNLVLVGDAAHPLLPFTSQGLAAAMEDAVVLAESLVTHHPLSLALASYSTRQQALVLPAVQRGREMTDRFVAGAMVDRELLPIVQ